MSVNKIILNDEVIVDLTGDTVTEDNVASGKIFHKANGEQSVGTGVVGGIHPVGTIKITDKGTHDVRNYEFAEVDELTNYYNTSDATADASMIRKGETAYGPDGMIIGKMETIKRPTPTISVRDNGVVVAKTIIDKSGYVNAGTAEAHVNLPDIEGLIPPEAIAKGTNILGVQGVFDGVVPITREVKIYNDVESTYLIKYLSKYGKLVEAYIKSGEMITVYPVVDSIMLVNGATKDDYFTYVYAYGTGQQEVYYGAYYYSNGSTYWAHQFQTAAVVIKNGTEEIKFSQKG